MGSWTTATWHPSFDAGVSRRDRRAGQYQPYTPDLLTGTPVVLSTEVDELVAQADREVRSISGGPHDDLAGISRFLLRSEAIASSHIEGIAPSAKQVGLAELGQVEDVPGLSAQAQLVANNMTIVQEATTALVAAERLTVDDIVQLHTSLLPTQPRHHGLRTVQNWVGGSEHHPLDADFVPPTPEQVAPLMADLESYLNGATHSALVQAALMHAQFETIHPFTDGNGRVGRALIHTVLTRRGLTPGAILPVSLVLATHRGKYVEALTAYRHDHLPGSTAASEAIQQWISVFAEAVLGACEQSQRLTGALSELRADWQSRLDAARRGQGIQRALRSDSATALILNDLPSTPVLTAATAQRIHGISHVSANRALDELRDAEILTIKSIGRGRTAYLANEVLNLLTMTERRLASTASDTRVSPPNRPVPAAHESAQ